MAKSKVHSNNDAQSPNDTKNASAETAPEANNNKENVAADQTQAKEDISETMTESDKALAALQAELDEANKKAAENWDYFLRAKADLENANKRAQADIEKARKFGLEKMVEDLIPVKDSLEMGLDVAKNEGADLTKVREGSELILKMLSDLIEKYGIQTLNPQDETFNPEFHQAMSTQESNKHKPNTVITVMQKGYLLNGRLIRPALVVVSKKPAAASSKPENKENEAIGTNVDEKA